jgi:tetratricopeptide (TPR) repeat protein
MKRIFILGIIMLFILNSFAEEIKPLGKVTLIIGKVEVKKEKGWEPLTLGANIYKDTEIRTGKKGKVEIEFINHERKILTENMCVKITDIIDFKPKVKISKEWINKILQKEIINSNESQISSPSSVAMVRAYRMENKNKDRYWDESDIKDDEENIVEIEDLKKVAEQMKRDLSSKKEDSLLYAESQYIIGEIYYRIGDYKKAIEEYKILIEKYKDSPYSNLAKERLNELEEDE